MKAFLVALYLLANGMEGALPTLTFDSLAECQAEVARLEAADPNDSPALFGGVPVVTWQLRCLQLDPPGP